MIQAGAPASDPLASAAGDYLLSGNEALARAALEAGVGFASSYPGSPITEVQGAMLEAAARHGGLHAEWSVNEHVALHAATGASWAGVRALVTMKQVGLHVAADPAAYLAYAGVKGGLVLGVGLDPGATSSTGEFDVRWLAREMHWIVLEPGTVREVYDFARRAWDLSEESGLPVLIDMPTGLCHQVSVVRCGALPDQPRVAGRFVPDVDSFVNVGARAVRNHGRLLGRLRAVRAQGHAWNRVEGAGPKALIAAGLHAALAREVLRSLGAADVPVLALGMSHPVDPAGLEALVAAGAAEALVLEELDGYLSHGLQAAAHQRRLPLWIASVSGEDGLAHGTLTFADARARVAEFLGIRADEASAVVPPALPDRPGTFCPGCSHRSPLYAIRQALGETGVYGGDIGCSSLPPHASDWLTCMGSGLGIAQGVALVSPGQKVIASIGDSTFYHSGLPVVLNAVQNGANLVLVVLDNQYVAMTGHQPTPGTATARGGGATPVPIEQALRGLGVTDIVNVIAYDLARVRFELAQAMARPGLKVLLVGGECRLQFGRREPERIAGFARYAIIPELCGRCGACHEELSCVAIQDLGTQLKIDQDACTRCSLCLQVCTDKAILPFRFTTDPQPS